MSARSASASAAACRSARSSVTQRPPVRISGRASCAKPSNVGRRQLDVVEHGRPPDVRAAGSRPTTDSDDASTNTRSDAVGRRRDSAGTRTSNPAGLELRTGVRHQVPRLVLAQDDFAASS